MSGFERVVRPFETGIVTPPREVPTAQVVKMKNVIINPGAGGTAKTMGGSYSLTITYYMINKPTEETTS